MTSATRRLGPALATAVIPLLTLTTALMLALQGGGLPAASLTGGALAGSLAALAWAAHRDWPRLSSVAFGAAAVPLALLVVTSPGAGVAALAIALGVVLVWSFHQ